LYDVACSFLPKQKRFRTKSAKNAHIAQKKKKYKEKELRNAFPDPKSKPQIQSDPDPHLPTHQPGAKHCTNKNPTLGSGDKSSRVTKVRAVF
jgi:hypothetical protein